MRTCPPPSPPPTFPCPSPEPRRMADLDPRQGPGIGGEAGRGGAGSGATWQMNPVTPTVTLTHFRQGIMASGPSGPAQPCKQTLQCSLRSSCDHAHSEATNTQSSLLSDGMRQSTVTCDKGRQRLYVSEGTCLTRAAAPCSQSQGASGLGASLAWRAAPAITENQATLANE